MPKIKTNKAAKKRFHVTGTGKLVRTKGPKSHLRRKKSKRVKRLLLHWILQECHKKLKILFRFNIQLGEICLE
jgi:ribosomal protein L35